MPVINRTVLRGRPEAKASQGGSQSTRPALAFDAAHQDPAGQEFNRDKTPVELSAFSDQK